MIYFGVDNGTPWDQEQRSGGKGDNLFLSSIVAINADTGEYVWHYQVNPGESWDYSAVQPMILADLTIGGTPHKALMQAPKTGFVYIPAQMDPFPYQGVNDFTYKPGGWNLGVNLLAGAAPLTPDQAKAAAASYQGFLIAWDPVNQKEVWRVQHPYFWNAGVV